MNGCPQSGENAGRKQCNRGPLEDQVNQKQGLRRIKEWGTANLVGGRVVCVNPFAPGDFAEKRILKLVEWFSGHCRAIKS